MSRSLCIALSASMLALAVNLAAAPGALAVDHTGGAYNTVYAGLGIKGYDPVAYFSDHKPVAGSESYTYDWKGVTWRFVSAEHRDAFKTNPEKYAPQYGGFCSWGVAQGKLFDVDPVNAWKIVGDKLYLNFNADIEKKWEADIPGFLQKSEKNWTTLNP